MILFFLLPLLAVPALSAMDEISCFREGKFEVDTSDGKKASIQGARMKVFFPRDNVRVYAYPNTTAANIWINETIVIFKGKLSIDNSEASSRNIDQAVFFQAKGLVKLQKYDKKTKLDECQIILIGNGIHSLNVPPEVRNEFLQAANDCVSSKMCLKIGTVQPEDNAISSNPDDFGPMSVYARIQKKELPLSSKVIETKKDEQIQSFINTIVDITLAELIVKLKEKHDEKIQIPDTNQVFSLGSGFFKTSGRFDATDGYFSDLTTLKRTNDVILERAGTKFSASCGFGLSTARIEYNHYKIKYGLIKFSGKMSADINGIAIDAKVSVDYNQHPCIGKLEYFKFSEFGKVKIKVTGLGPFNSLASSLVTWITKKWQSDITKLVETKVSSILNKQIQNFNCEKYRP